MNFSEFRKMLGAEPRSRDPEFLRARDSSPEFRDAAREAVEFENKLESALGIGVPQDLMERITAIPNVVPIQPRRTRPAWARLAMAAVVVAAVGVAGVVWYESLFRWDSVDDFIVDHWDDDGAEFLAQADGQPDDDAAAMFARYGVTVSPELAKRIDYIHACRTPGSRGAHMVIITEQGPVTLIFMPKVEAESGHLLAFNDLVAATLPLENGSAVIIGANEEVIAPIYAMARNGIRPLAKSI